jgi:hypothetical protein
MAWTMATIDGGIVPSGAKLPFASIGPSLNSGAGMTRFVARPIRVA